MLPRCTLLLLLSIFSFPIAAQTLRGTVSDADNNRPVAGASATLLGAMPPQNTVTDSAGTFVFQNLRPGYYRCEVKAESFENQTIVEIDVAAGKERVVAIALRRSSTALPVLTVTSNNPRLRPPLPLGEIPLTREQTLRFPATFFDPARLAMTYPGVANNDDQANGLNIRGNSPASVRWRLEGVDVVNPNHLTNAGTFSDRPTAAAGGVAMFSAQMLDNSSLLTGSFPAGYGDALGGIMDMNLRRGNSRQHEFTAQAGLIGLDLAAEGPLNGRRHTVEAGRQASYLANYRYSTVGLLGQMGISFGDEQIDFQDLSFKLNFQGKNGGEWSVFGLGGLSKNVFEHKTDSASIKQLKDFFDIDYQSKTGIIGLSNWSPLGKRGWVKITLAASAQSNERTAVSFSEQYEEFDSSDELDESKISGSIAVAQRIHDQWRITAGVLLTRQYFKGASSEASMPPEIARHEYLASQPWANLAWNSRDEKTAVQIGLHSLIFPPKDRITAEPRLTVAHALAPNQRLAFSGGLYSQIAPLWLPSNSLDLMRAWHTGLRYAWNLTSEWAFETELFWQRQTDVGVDAGEANTFSLLNENDYRLFSQKTFIYNGLGDNQGIEISAERYLADGWFALLNATFLGARYRGSDEVWRASRWDVGHILNLTGGKEWQRDKRPGRVNAFGINGRFGWSGGLRAMPVDVEASEDAGTTVFDDSAGFSVKQKDYFRLDLRVYWKRSLGNFRNSTFAMDFQNATMQENIAYQYWDPFTEKVETKKQLGLIPNISWRLEF